MLPSSDDQVAAATAQESHRLEENANIEVRGVAGAGRGLFWCGPNIPAG